MGKSKVEELEVLSTDTEETCTYYYKASREICGDEALAEIEGEPRCQHHIVLFLRQVAKEVAKDEE